MDYKQLFEFLQTVEGECPVQEWTMEGIPVWPLVRLRMGRDLLTGKGNVAPGIESVSVSSLWGNYIKLLQTTLIDEWKLLYRDYKHQAKIRPCDVVLLGDADDRNVQMPTGELMDHNLDPIDDALRSKGYRVFKFEEINRNGARFPRWTKSFAINYMMMKALVKKKMNKGAIKNISIDVQLFHHIMEKYSQLSSNNHSVTLDVIISDVAYLLFFSKEFLTVLKQLAPRLVILECWYSTYKMALCLAAHKLKIPVVEVQHGLIGVHHAYYNWRNMPSGGYEIMPNYMWVWNEEDIKAVASWGDKKVVPFLGGKPMNLIWCNKGEATTQYYLNKYKNEIGDDRPVILFTLGYLMYYPDWLSDFINESDEYMWLIRTHPGKPKHEFLNRLVEKQHIVWKKIDKFPLEILLQKISVHITMLSSVVIEGEEVRCPSIVMHPMAREIFAQQIQNGIACYANNREDLSAAIRDSISRFGARHNDSKRMEELYVRGQSGIRHLIEIMEGSRDRV